MVRSAQTMYRILAICLLAAVASVRGQDCVWNKDTDFPVIPPLLIDLNTWISLKAVDEAGQRVVRIAQGTSVVVACSGTLITSLGIEVAEAVCSGGQNLDIGGSLYTIQDLECASTIQNSVLDTAGTCGDQGIGITADLGFVVTGYPFYKVISLCFETKNEITLYSIDTVYGNNVDASDGNPEKPYFTADDPYYPILDPNDCYLTANQDAYFTSFTGDADYIDLNSDTYFARGHLAPNADFLTDMEADASYHYLNAVPQWQLYNAGNWMYLESDARDLALAHRSDLTVYTGPWGNLVLTDINNNPTTMYLCFSQGQQLLPIPRLMWKVVFEPSTNRALAVITSHYPYEQTAPTPACPDLGCDTFSWLTFDSTDLTKGFTYCCTWQDWRAVNPHAPDLVDATLLTD